MNESELDQLLNSWEAPAPPRSLREGLQARFPRSERRQFARPLRWGLAIVVLTVALAGMAQTGAGGWDIPLVRVLTGWYSAIMSQIEIRTAIRIRDLIRESNPQVYVDGQLSAPLVYGHAGRMDVQVPGDGVYSIVLYSVVSGHDGWVQAGRVHQNVIEFQAGNREVRIVCDRPVAGSDRPVFVGRRR